MVKSDDLNPNQDQFLKSLPVHLHEKPSVSVLAMLGAGLSAAMGLALFTAIGVYFQINPEASKVGATLGSKPILALELGLAILVISLMLFWPAIKIVCSLSRSRHITITRDDVLIRQSTLLGQKRWLEPLGSYSGPTWQQHSTLGGSRHRLVLGHPDHRRSIILWSDVEPKADIADHYANLLARQAA